MNHDETNPQRARLSRTATGVGLVAAGVLAGGVLAASLSASADTTPSATATQGTTQSGGAGQSGGPGQSGPAGQGQRPKGGKDHGSAPVRSDEKALSAADAAKVKAAALAAVPGGTVYRVETDAGDATYEAHMTKADGTEVTVKLDAAFTVTGTEQGMGKGDPAPSGQQGRAPQGSQPGSAPSASSSAAA